jgi:hypothetical protein
VVLTAIDPAHAHEKPLQLDKGILRAGKSLSTVLYELACSARVRALRGGVLRAPHSGTLSHAGQAGAPRNCVWARGANARIARSRQWSLPANLSAAPRAHQSQRYVVMGAISRSGYKGLLVGLRLTDIDDLSCDI